MKLADIITDEYISQLAVTYSDRAEGGKADWQAVKLLALEVAAHTARQCQVILHDEEPVP